MIYSWKDMKKQKSLQSLTNRSLEQLASMRVQADRLILDIWNQVEAKFQDVSPNEKRLEKCRDYGLIYYYRTGEKNRIRRFFKICLSIHIPIFFWKSLPKIYLSLWNVPVLPV